jgi:hypothetical protein
MNHHSMASEFSLVDKSLEMETIAHELAINIKTCDVLSSTSVELYLAKYKV